MKSREREREKEIANVYDTSDTERKEIDCEREKERET